MIQLNSIVSLIATPDQPGQDQTISGNSVDSS
jgi:hypothetical protein